VAIEVGGSVVFAGSNSSASGEAETRFRSGRRLSRFSRFSRFTAYRTPRMQYLWNFGSGSGIPDSTEQNPGARQFNIPGTFEVTLTVTDPSGILDPSSEKRVITVGSPPPSVSRRASASNPRPVLARESVDGALYPTFTITKPAVPDGVERMVEVSPNLVDWFSGPGHVVVITNNETTLKVRGKNPVSATPCCYFRLKEVTP